MNTDKGNRNMDLSVLTPIDEPTNWVGSKEWHPGNGGSEIIKGIGYPSIPHLGGKEAQKLVGNGTQGIFMALWPGWYWGPMVKIPASFPVQIEVRPNPMCVVQSTY